MRTRRWILSTAAAVMLAAGMVTASGWVNPLCALYQEGDMMWYLLQCWDFHPPMEGG